ncbi:hypothetical protein Dip510_001461 [Elusimicrobium posterum]|uniref:DUF4402 domain-containing protein n=1 Tax=Elusimicrobium posterum TaxID=3116653 RepID=UPI003C767634
MRKVILATAIVFVAAAYVHAAAAKLLSSTPLDFGAVSVTSLLVATFSVTVNPSTGAVTTTGSPALRIGGIRGTLSIGTIDNSAGTIYVRNVLGSSTALSLLGCSGLLTSASISNVNVDVPYNGTPNSKASVSTFYYGGTLTFTSILNITPRCDLSGCIQNAFCVKQGSAPASATDCDFLAPFCYSVSFAGQTMAVAHRSGSSLRFGSACPSGSTGYITVTPAGSATASGGAGCFSSSGAGADIFDLTGTANYAYYVTFPTSITISNGSNTLTVDNFTSLCPSGAGCTLNSSGTGSFNVGGRLTIPSGAPSGTYTGSYTLTVNY